jgi:hypothetical protein
MAASIDDAIEKIVRAVPAGHIFDSHFVIRQLIKKSSDEYLSFAGKSAPLSRKPTLPTHGKIGQKINKLSGQLVKKMEDYPSWSENVREKPSRCTCWIKLKEPARRAGDES